MKRIILIKPAEVHFSAVLAYKHAVLAKEPIIHGSRGLERFGDDELARWLEYVYAPAGTNWFGYELVEDSTYLAWHLEQDRLIGFINIRHELSDYLRQFGGHIGYSVHPDFWNQGFATEMLSQALKECDKLGLHEILITCNKSNPASAKVIVKNGGVFENEVANGENITQRYWITR